MFVIIGISIVTAAILGGYLLEHGNLSVLMQPAELVIIGGAALGAFVVAAPLRLSKKLSQPLSGCLVIRPLQK